MDNGINFKGKDMKSFSKKFHITQTFSSVYYPQENGQDKASNKTIKSILAKTWDRYKAYWHEQLPYTLWKNRKSIRIAIGAKTFSLVYRYDVILPLEQDIPSLIISLQGDILDEEVRKARLQKL